jgi:hypothetical protein
MSVSLAVVSTVIHLSIVITGCSFLIYHSHRRAQESPYLSQRLSYRAAWIIVCLITGNLAIEVPAQAFERYIAEQSCLNDKLLFIDGDTYACHLLERSGSLAVDQFRDTLTLVTKEVQ